MAPRKTSRARHNSASEQNYEQKIQLKKRKELFIQQFEKEAQDRINEMEANLEKLLATVDRAFKIEMMKLPPSLHNTLIKDLMSDHDTSVGEVTMAITSASPEMTKPLTRIPSKKGLSDTGAQKSSGQSKTVPAEGQKKRAKKTLHSSNSTGSLRCASTISAKRTQGRVVKLSDAALVGRSRKMNRSVGDEVMAAATIVTSFGETLYLSEDNKDDISVDLLDDSAVTQMRRIKELMDYLCGKAALNNTR